MTTLEDYDALPDAMRQAPRWLLWKSEPSVGDRKPRKVPYYVSGRARHGQLDGPDDLANLVTLEVAVAALRAPYAGLGFALGPDGTGNHWQGIDLDALSEHPELEHIAEDLPGYTETSPSGNGRHAIGYGRAFQALGSNGSGIEAYSAGRYFTVTGEGAGLGTPTCLANFINSKLRPIHGTRPTTEATVTETIADRTKAELRSALAAMRADDRDLWVANGQRLKKLGDTGRALWMEWSQTSDKFDSADAARVWDSLDGSATGYAAIFAEAQRQGWVNPLAGGAAPAPTQGPHKPMTRVSLDGLMTATLRPPAFVIAPYVPRGVVTLLGGHGGIGKSMLALTLCAHVAAGRPWANTEVEQGRVVCLSFEDDAEIVRYRLRQVIETYELPAAAVVSNLRIFDGTQVEAELMREVSHHGVSDLVETPALAEAEEAVKGADLIVIDNASDVYGGAENVRSQVRKFVRRLAQIAKANGAGMVLLVHIDKAAAKNGASGNSYSGSTAWHNSARSRVALLALEDGSIELHQEKLNLGKKAEPLLMEHDNHGVLVPRGSGSSRQAAMDGQAATDAGHVLLAMTKAIEAGITVSTSTTGPAQAVHALEQVPELPAALRSKDGRKRVNAALIRLQRDGLIRRVEFQKANRHMAERWELTQETPE